MVSNSTSFLFFPIFSATGYLPSVFAGRERTGVNALKGKSFCLEGFYAFL